MPTIAILYHSGFGHTEAVARSVRDGIARIEGVEPVLVRAAELPDPDPDQGLGAEWEVLHDADMIVFGCPTYMGTVSAPFKRVMDATSPLWFKQGWRDKLAAGFTNAGGLSGDKLNTLTTLTVFAAQHSMIWVTQGIFMGEGGINRMGAWLGLMTQSGNASPEVTPPEEDHETARRFGERLAHATLRWHAGAPAAMPELGD